MTKSGWCRSNYHSDGKRRWGFLEAGLCCECSLALVGKEADKVTRLQEKISDLMEERAQIEREINGLRQKLRAFTQSLKESGVTKS